MTLNLKYQYSCNNTTSNLNWKANSSSVACVCPNTFRRHLMWCQPSFPTILPTNPLAERLISLLFHYGRENNGSWRRITASKGRKAHPLPRGMFSRCLYRLCWVNHVCQQITEEPWEIYPYSCRYIVSSALLEWWRMWRVMYALCVSLCTWM